MSKNTYMVNNLSLTDDRLIVDSEPLLLCDEEIFLRYDWFSVLL